MNNDIYLTILISIFIIFILSKTRLHIRNQPVILHFTILLCIVFLFYAKFEKSAFMASLLYLIMYVQSYKMKEYFASTEILPQFSLNDTVNRTDKIAENILINNRLPSQLSYWFTGDSFSPSTKDIQWRDLASNNHIQFESSNVKLNSSITNNTSGPQKWVSGDVTTQVIIPLPASTAASTNDGVTFIHLTRYSPRSSNRGKLWTSSTGTWVSGYNDNKITVANKDGPELVGWQAIGDLMNIQGSNWNLFFDQMDASKNMRTVYVNGTNYVFNNGLNSAIPDFIGLNIGVSTDDKSDWDCAEIMIYRRILDTTEIAQITSYFNKKYSLKHPNKIKENKYYIYNHSTFNSITDSDWQSPPQVGSTTQSGNKLLGITDSEYECVSLCDKNTPSCAAFSYHMEKGVCYSVDEKNILNHTTQNKATLSGTNKIQENIAQKAKEEADRKAKEEAERKRLADIAAAIEAERQRLIAVAVAEAAAAEAKRLRLIALAEAAAAESERNMRINAAAAAAEAERQRLAVVAEQQRLAIVAAVNAERQKQAVAEAARQKQILTNRDRFIPIFDKDSNEAMGKDGIYKVNIHGNVFPCYNVSPNRYINGGGFGSVLDNNDTTGVDIESYQGTNVPYRIVITLPFEKTFKGIFYMRLITPWAECLPKNISLETYNSNAFLSNWWQVPVSYDTQFKIEEMNLGEVGGLGNGPYDHSWDINFTKPFKHIVLSINAVWTGYRNYSAWITSLNFINKSDRIYGAGPSSGKNCPVNSPSFSCFPDGSWKEPANDGQHVWYWDWDTSSYYHKDCTGLFGNGMTCPYRYDGNGNSIPHTEP